MEAAAEFESPPAGAARCRHFGRCGGCARQDLPYPDQVTRKRDELVAILGRHAEVLGPVETGASEWYYRNKMEFAFGFADDAIALGLRQKGRFFGVVNLEECFLMTEVAAPVLAATREWAAAHGLAPYHLRRHEGLLRYLVLREGKRTGDRLAIIVTAAPVDEAVLAPALDDLGGRLAALGVTSLLWVVNDRQADVAVGEIRRVVTGRAWFEETLSGLSFKLSPYAFFQPNVALAERLGARAGEWLGSGWPVLVDLYCGVGGLSLPLAGRAKQVLGVELEEAAVRDAGENAARNGITNARFIAEDALTFLRRFSNFSFLADKWALILDPPRSGTHPKVPAQVLRLAPPVLIYVSCNPKKLAEDLEILTQDYRLDAAVPFDFFPHTPHIEVLAKLTRK